MIVPRITFFGDPAAATPWVGMAKKLARECYTNKISHKVYRVGEGVQIRVENIFPVLSNFGGVCKAWIEASGGGVDFLLYPKTYLAYLGYTHSTGLPKAGLPYQLSFDDYRLYRVSISNTCRVKNVSSQVQKRNQFYINPKKQNLVFYSGPSNDLSLYSFILDRSGYPSRSNYFFVNNDLLVQPYQPIVYFRSTNHDAGITYYGDTVLVSPLLTYTYPLINPATGALNAVSEWVPESTRWSWLIQVEDGPDASNTVLGMFKRGAISYAIEVIIPNSGDYSINLYFVVRISGVVSQQILLRNMLITYNSLPDFHPWKFNSIGTEVSCVICEYIEDDGAKNRVKTYTITTDEDGLVSLEMTQVEVSSGTYDFTGTTVIPDPLIATWTQSSTRIEESTCPIAVWYDENDVLQIARYVISETYTIDSALTNESTGWGTNYTSDVTYIYNTTDTLLHHIDVDGTLYQIKNISRSSYKTHDFSSEGIEVGDELTEVWYIQVDSTLTQTMGSSSSGYDNYVLMLDCKNKHCILETGDGSASNDSTLHSTFHSYSNYRPPSPTEETNETTSSSSNTFNNTYGIDQYLVGVHNLLSTPSLSGSSSSSLTTPTSRVLFPIPSMEDEEGTVTTHSDVEITRVFKWDSGLPACAHYAGVNLTDGYHYILNITGVYPTTCVTLAPGLFESRGYTKMNIIVSSVTNLESKLPIDGVSIYPISLYTRGYADLTM